MRERIVRALRDTGRSVVGGLIGGLPLLYTMETWWLAWRLPMWLLMTFALLGLALITLVIRHVGFHAEESGRVSTLPDVIRSLGELLVHSYVLSYLILLLFGVLDQESQFDEIVRMGTIQVVPVGLGIAVANHVLPEGGGNGRGNGGGEMERTSLKREAAAFALGATFFAIAISPTEEMELMAAHAGWVRLALVPPLAILITYITLYELEFRGSRGRVAAFQSQAVQVGEVFVAYVLALIVSAALLAGYGHFLIGSVEEVVQKTVVLSLVASVGGAAARVVV